MLLFRFCRPKIKLWLSVLPTGLGEKSPFALIPCECSPVVLPLAINPKGMDSNFHFLRSCTMDHMVIFQHDPEAVKLVMGIGLKTTLKKSKFSPQFQRLALLRPVFISLVSRYVRFVWQ